MANELIKDDIDPRYFHKLAEEEFFHAIDDILLGPEIEGPVWVTSTITGKREQVVRKHRPHKDDAFLYFCFGIGDAAEMPLEERDRLPISRPKHAFRMFGGRWVYGDMTPVYPGAFISRMPFMADDDILVAFMFCEHDGVCDEPPMATLFFEGGLSGDVDNLAVIMVYDKLTAETAMRLDELGVLFLCASSVPGAGVPEPYFSYGSLESTHESFDGDTRIVSKVDVPELARWDEEDVFGAYRLACLLQMFWSLEVGELHMPPGRLAGKLLRGFAMALPESEKPERPEFPRRGGGGRVDHEERIREQRLARKRASLVYLMANVHPVADGGDLLERLRREDDNIKGILAPWRDALKEFPVQFRPNMLGEVMDEEGLDRLAYEIQDLGRRLGV